MKKKKKWLRSTRERSNICQSWYTSCPHYCRTEIIRKGCNLKSLQGFTLNKSRIFLKTHLRIILISFQKLFFRNYSECGSSGSAAYPLVFTVGNRGTFRRITLEIRPIWVIDSLTIYLLLIKQNVIEKLRLTGSYYRYFLRANLLIFKKKNDMTTLFQLWCTTWHNNMEDKQIC